MTVECAVVDIEGNSTEYLESIASTAVLSDAHLTVLHVGRLRDLGNELEAQSSSAFSAVVDFVPLLQQFASSIEALGSQTYRVVCPHIITFDAGGSRVVALAVQSSPELDELRSVSRAAMIDVLDKAGVRDAEAFAATSTSIAQYSPAWLPHITLGMTPQAGSPPPDELIDIRLELAPAHLRGVSRI